MKTLQLIALATTVTMNVSYSQSITNVWGSEDSLATVAQIKQSLYHLSVHEPIRLDVIITERMPKHLEGITLAYNVPNTDQQYYKVRINARLNAATQRLVLAHEMVHIKQYVKQELRVVDQQHALWKGKIYDFEQVHHRRTPWERAAFRMHHQLAKLTKEPTSMPLTASKAQ